MRQSRQAVVGVAVVVCAAAVLGGAGGHGNVVPSTHLPHATRVGFLPATPESTGVVTGPTRVGRGNVSLLVPAGWTGEARGGGTDGRLPVMRTANVRLTAGDDDPANKTQQRLHGGAILINVWDYGNPRQHRQWPHGRLPITVTRRDLGSFAGCLEAPACANIDEIVMGKSLWVEVMFGRSHPTAGDLSRANNVLRRLRITPR